MIVRPLAVSALLMACAHASASWPEYSIFRVGLYDGPHTGSSGTQNNNVVFTSPGGVFAGHADRFIGVSTQNGRDAWAWSGGATIQLGLTGPGYVGSSNRQDTTVQFMNSTGSVLGFSYRYTPTGLDNGSDTWIWNGATTVTLGLTGPAYVGSAGYRATNAQAFSNTGQAVGYTYSISGVNSDNGQEAWFYNGTNTVPVGFSGPAYEGSAGYRRSTAQALNDAGRVAGSTFRITGVNTLANNEAWVFDGVSTTRVGLTAPANTGSAGYQSSSVQFMASSGMTIGSSARFRNVNTYNGADLWSSDGITTTQIGLVGGAFTGSQGFQVSAVDFFSPAGVVVGHSTRYTGINDENGQGIWIWNGSQTIQLGYTSAAYTGNTGYQISAVSYQSPAGRVVGASGRILDTRQVSSYDWWVWNGTSLVPVGLTGGIYTVGDTHATAARAINDAGQVAGWSRRYNNGSLSSSGQDAWFFDGTTTTLIGLTSATYTDPQGFRENDIGTLNASGVVVGIARRISGGQDTWYYNPVTNTTSLVVSSVRASDGYATSGPQVLTADGTLYGVYSYYGDNSGQPRAFAYRPDRGFTELGPHVHGGLSAANWNLLYQSSYCTSAGVVVGKGVYNSVPLSNSSIYALVPLPCPADFNLSGASNVQDIFDFLAAWFAGDPRADFNGLNGTTISDIFDFLAAWFLGCS